MFQNYISIQQAAEEFVSDITRSKSRNTVNVYTRSVNMFLAFIEQLDEGRSKPVSDISISQSTSFISSLEENEYSKSTYCLYAFGLKRFLSWLIEKDYITVTTQEYQSFLENLNSSMRTFQKTENRLGHEELTPEILINAANSRDVNVLEKFRDIAIINLFLSTNCRPYEVILLKVCDLELNNRTGIIQMENGKTRHLVFDSETSLAFSRYWRIRGWRLPMDPALARHDKGAGKRHKFLTTRSIQNIIQNIIKAAGLDCDITSDEFRKSFYLKALDYPIDISSSNQTIDTPYFSTSVKYYPPRNDENNL